MRQFQDETGQEKRAYFVFNVLLFLFNYNLLDLEVPMQQVG